MKNCPSPTSWIALAALAFTTCFLPSTARGQIDDRSAGQQRFVTTGRLIRSGQARNGTPRFALLDEQGAITSYVVPASGLSLGKHVNTEVAVTARRVSRGDDGLSYLLAQSVAPMETLGFTEPMAADAAVEADAVAAAPADEPEVMDDISLAGYTGDDPLAPLEPPAITDELAAAPPSFAAAARASSLRRRSWDRVGTSVRPVAHQQVEEMPFEVPYDGTESVADGAFEQPPGSYMGFTPGANAPGCPTCGQHQICGSACCPCGPPGQLWLRGEYLLWWPKGMSLPPLVTTTTTGNPTAQTAGVLGNPGTAILYGGNEVLKESRNGGRFRIGKWLDNCQWRGFEADYFFVENASDSFSRTSVGNPILARPFFNTQTNAQDSELVAFPGIVSGTINVVARSNFDAFAPRFRFNLACRNAAPDPAAACGFCNSCGDTYCRPAGSSRVDFTLGYRFMRLNESLHVTEQLASTVNNNPSTFNLADTFDTTNQFHGLELGLVWEGYRGPWSMELIGRFILGNNRREVVIGGNTISTAAGNSFSDVGGLLALPSNIGTYSDNEFVVIPELGANVGYQIAPNLRFLVGYTFIYWGNVVRPGEQIDLNVNPDLLPPAVATTGRNAPAFAMTDTSYWLQGLNFGLDWRW